MNAVLALCAALADRLRALGRRGKAVAAFLLGAASSAALPPFQILPAALIAFVGLIWLLDTDEPAAARRRRSGFFIGWWFGFGHFLTGFYWLTNALLLDAGEFVWLMPLAVGAFSAGLALFTALLGAAYGWARLRGLARILVFALLWTAAEWLRGHILTGFPWNLMGTIWTGVAPMMQGAALFGLYGLSLLTVLAAAAPATLADRTSGASRRWAGLALTVALLAIGWAAGAARLPASWATVPGVALRLVQPNVPQTLKWDPDAAEQNFRAALALTRSPGFETRTHVIWPETAVPFVLTDFVPDGRARRAALASVTPQGGLLITGAPRAARDAAGRLQFWNSLQAIDSTGALVANYDKTHLVPFGEYVPLRSLIGWLPLPAGATDFSVGEGPVTLTLPGLPPASPLICYEAIFPGKVVDRTHRPDWLLNISNDAWFGISSGPFQHLAATRFRAVEEGLPLVRATNDGVTAVIDPYGRILAQLGLGETGVVDADLPAVATTTLYARWSDWTLFALCGAVLLFAVLIRR